MQKLIDTIASGTGLNTAEAELALHTLADFVKEKYPLLSDMVDTILEYKVPKDEEVLL